VLTVPVVAVVWLMVRRIRSRLGHKGENQH
jgi:hypothetical protein